MKLIFDPDSGPRANNEWAARLSLYQEAQQYFYGDIFNRRSGEGTDVPLLYPLRLNMSH